MTYYLAIDNRAYYRPAMRILQLIPSNSVPNLNMRTVRNYAIDLMKEHPEIWAITIMKRIKKNTYTGIEMIYPDGITTEGAKEGWGFIHDWDIEPHECDTDTFTSTYKVIETI